MNPIAFNTSSASAPCRDTTSTPAAARRPGDSAQAQRSIAREADQADFSSRVRLSTDESQAPVRLDLVRRIREQLSADSYETPDKLDIAAERAAIDLDILA